MSTSDPGSVSIPATDNAGNVSEGVIDPAVIARLANEFFSALPGAKAVATLPPLPYQPAAGADLPGVPAATSMSAPEAAVPTALPDNPPGAPHYFLGAEGAPIATPVYPTPAEMLSFPSVPGAQTGVGIPSFFGPLPEGELSAIPGSLADISPTRAPVYTSSDAPAMPGAAAYFLEGAKTSPWAVAPHFPADLFAFSSVPGIEAAPAVPAAFSPVPAVPSIPPSGFGQVPETKSSAPIAEEPRLGSLEFRPELVPQIGFSKRMFDPHIIKRDFPILQEQINGRPLVWLDNAATTHKPRAVMDRLTQFYEHENSNIHRAAHTLAARSTDAYEGARDKVRRFLNAGSTREIVFVRGATEGINLVAKSWGWRYVQKDDEIVITWLEHHANIVPWQQLAAEKGARLRVAPVDDTGQVILDEYEKLLGPRTRIVAFSQVSNALGTVTPAKQMIEMAHRHGAKVLLDAAQSVAHLGADVQDLDCDFLVFSGHKIFAPTGIGVVFGKAGILDNTPPWQGGGNMIADVTFEKTLYQSAPARFEAGTGNIADAVGLGAALDYLEEIGMENIARYEHELLEYGTAGLLTVPGIRLIGTAKEKAGVMSFVLDNIPPEEVGKALDQEGIAVRAGHHCAQPILRRFGLEQTVRPSLALYNTKEDMDALVVALLRLQANRRKT